MEGERKKKKNALIVAEDRVSQMTFISSVDRGSTWINYNKTQ
jgi:hypothetical protein